MRADASTVITDSSVLEFWCPDNWPGLRAPCKVEVTRRRLRPDGSPPFYPDDWAVYVSLWVRIAVDRRADNPMARPPGDDDLWTWGFSAASLANLAETIAEGERWLKAERDEELARLAGGVAAATEALLDLEPPRA